MGATKLTCKECGADYGLEARYVCDRCFGPLEVAYEHDVAGRRARAPAHPGRPAEHLALSRLPAARGPAAAHPHRPARRVHAAHPRRPPGRAAGPARGVGQERRRQPHALLQGPRRLGRHRARPRAGLHDARLRLDRQPGQLGRRARRRARAWTPTSSSRPTSRSRRSSPPAIYGTKLVKVDGNYDDVNRLCTELCGERDWAFVNVNMRPYYAEGSKTLGLRDRRAARLGGARPRRGADRLGLALHQDRQGLPGLPRPRPRRRRAPR